MERIWVAISIEGKWFSEQMEELNVRHGYRLGCWVYRRRSWLSAGSGADLKTYGGECRWMKRVASPLRPRRVLGAVNRAQVEKVVKLGGLSGCASDTPKGTSINPLFSLLWLVRDGDDRDDGGSVAVSQRYAVVWCWRVGMRSMEADDMLETVWLAGILCNLIRTISIGLFWCAMESQPGAPKWSPSVFYRSTCFPASAVWLYEVESGGQLREHSAGALGID